MKRSRLPREFETEALVEDVAERFAAELVSLDLSDDPTALAHLHELTLLWKRPRRHRPSGP